LTAHGLIDTTEMYLRTTVARMERDGLVRVEGDRHLAMTELGRALATRVMRKHRLAELLLTQVIGMPWEEVHIEACRWEHVMSDSVEARLVTLLGNPTRCPHGNPIPGLAELGAESAAKADAAAEEKVMSMTEVVGATEGPVVIRRISEQVQSDPAVMLKLKQVGIQPGREVTLVASDDGVRVIGDEQADNTPVDLPRDVAAHVFVARP
jgi:DtxR family Mn-dependent transcriptional regulator